MKIKLKGGKNFRDLGGIRTSDDSTVKPGLFLRGAHLSNLEDRDIAYLKENFDIATVVDLRTSEERGELPDRDIPGAGNVHVPVLSARTAGLSHENKGTTLKSISKARPGKKELEKIIPDLAVIYPRMMWPEAGEKFRETLDIVMKNAAQSRATLYHCTVGKDRTGIVSLLILTMLGADRKTITRDYLLTNRAAAAEANKNYLKLFIATFSHKLASRLRGCYIAKKSFLDSYYAAVEKEYGSVENYIRNGLGITDEQVASFRECSLIKPVHENSID
ncbi:MAG: tyrosine-protein phosphatase [Clostridia bacterium]|nr:tyrosine-protein phosphatase [Clostridia bacterium]